jgi:hypothetical protein
MAKGSFTNLLEVDVKLNDSSILKMKLDKNTNSGALNLQLREFKTAGDYTGPTPNGVTVRIESVEQVAEIKDNFLKFIDSVKTVVEKQ